MQPLRRRSRKKLQKQHRKQPQKQWLRRKKLQLKRQKKKAEEEAAKKAEEKKEGEDDKEEEEAKQSLPTAEKEEEEEEQPEDEEEEEDDSKAVDFDAVDIFGVEDVADVGDGSPLFKMFGFEDWAMLGLRFELHLLSHAFTKDADDPDRKGVHLDHLGFYYQKYFKKTLNLKFYGLEANVELVNLVEDTIRLKGSVIESRLPESLESLGIFVKITEESRRDRTRLIDLGEESAKLKIQSGLQSSLAPVGGGKGGAGVNNGGSGFVQSITAKGPPQHAWGGKGGGGGGGGSGGGSGGGGGAWGSWNNNKGGKNQGFGARPAPYPFGGKKGSGKSYGKSWSK